MYLYNNLKIFQLIIKYLNNSNIIIFFLQKVNIKNINLHIIYIYIFCLCTKHYKQKTNIVKMDALKNEKLKALFNKFDKNQTGYIERDELKQLLIALGESPSSTRIEKLV